MDEKIVKMDNRVIIKHRNEIVEGAYHFFGFIFIIIGLINISNINFSLFLFGGIFVLLIKQRRKIWFEDYIEFNDTIIYLRFRDSHVKKIKFKHIVRVDFKKSFFVIETSLKGKSQTLFFNTKNMFTGDIEKIKQIFGHTLFIKKEEDDLFFVLKVLKRFYS